LGRRQSGAALRYAALQLAMTAGLIFTEGSPIPSRRKPDCAWSSQYLKVRSPQHCRAAPQYAAASSLAPLTPALPPLPAVRELSPPMPPEPGVNPPFDTFSCSPEDAADPPVDVPPVEPSGFPFDALEPGPQADNASQTTASDDAPRRADSNLNHAIIVSTCLEHNAIGGSSVQRALPLLFLAGLR